MTHSSPPFEAVVFDFDGTLAELVIDFAAMKDMVAREAAARQAGTPPPNGLPALEYAALLAGRIRESSPDEAAAFEAAVARGIRDQEIAAAAAARLFPATKAALTRLADAGAKVGVITRNCRAAVLTVFPDLTDYAGVLLARDDARRVKPDPGHLLDALAALGVAPARALMVGDHPMDIATGRAAGTRTAGVASGRTTLATLAEHSPDYLAPDVGALVAMLGH
ncbi:HAD-IA family hydrolase [Solidesulfovibrio sp.]|uniref:HAD family hydrolase n=1 Tax=Solidesulfovibrio sp. TaxID=2910990 RepID=UPI002614BBAB|nr:HAD-IA family hydrolase [Solidesulfovibrio sp.]